MTDSATKDWIRGPADERAAAAGCRFEEERGRFVVGWIERYLRLYEGEYAGEPMHLRDWQLDATLRLFGWVRWSNKWERWVRRFRAASIWIAKKNKKSPTLAAWGLYLLAGDGEQGQKVFFAAKNGQQAREIAGKHAIEMLRKCPELEAECRVNKNTSQITHLPSRSIILPLSNNNSAAQQAKEGINGSILVDECHVVDRDFMRRVSRAGISRSEPLQIEVSTAGDNPDGYGKERFDYAVMVEKGDVEDQELFTAIYAAPQDLTDADLDADPLKYAKMANPALGHTVDPEELLDDYNKSKRQPGKLLDCKMYRFNIWQRSSNPWLKASDWDKCRRAFSATDLFGRVCYAGLDLSRTRDMTALALLFPWHEEGPECYRILPYFWLPEDRAAELDGQVPVMAWARSGDLKLTPGGVVDYGHIKACFRALHELYTIKELVYDPRYAEEVTQTLEQGTMDDKGESIEEGTGVPRFVFEQNDKNFAAPTEDWERLVIAGNLHHNGHPVLAWQIGHAHCITRATSRAKRVVKPSNSRVDPRTIDGVVAGIMALARAMMSPIRQASVYETRGMAVLDAGTGHQASQSGMMVLEADYEEDDD